MYGEFVNCSSQAMISRWDVFAAVMLLCGVEEPRAVSTIFLMFNGDS